MATTKLFPIVQDYLNLKVKKDEALATKKFDKAEMLTGKMARLYDSMTAAAQRQLSGH